MFKLISSLANYLLKYKLATVKRFQWQAQKLDIFLSAYNSNSQPPVVGDPQKKKKNEIFPYSTNIKVLVTQSECPPPKKGRGPPVETHWFRIVFLNGWVMTPLYWAAKFSYGLKSGSSPSKKLKTTDANFFYKIWTN